MQSALWKSSKNSISKEEGAACFKAAPVTQMLIATAAFMLTSVRMTFHTVLVVGNALFNMLCANICLAVFVAAIAGIANKAGRVAGYAGYQTAFTVIEGEGVRLVILCRRPRHS